MFATYQVRNARDVIFNVEVDTATNLVTFVDTRDGQRLPACNAETLLAHEGGLHIWGNEPTWMLTAENVEEVQRDIVRTFHLHVWDMPALLADHLPVIQWLAARYEVHFGIVSEVYIVDKRTGVVFPTTATDVREALDMFLSSVGADA